MLQPPCSMLLKTSFNLYCILHQSSYKIMVVVEYQHHATQCNTPQVTRNSRYQIARKITMVAKVDTCIDQIIKVNRTTRMIPCYTYLKTLILLLVQTFKDRLLDLPHIGHRLDMIIKHHTSIHAIIHEANNRTKLEQYTKHMKQQVKRF